MKEYVKKHHELSYLGERIYWWILRLLMVWAMIDSAFFKHDTTQVLQTGANLVGMFAWEIMLTKKRSSFFYYVPSYVQNITLLGFFLGSFGGAYMNFYYSIPAYDMILHVFGGAEACFIGYEIVTAIQKRDRKIAPVAMILLCSCGISFIFGTGWEIFEFTFDQIAGGDSQHWSMELAKQAMEEYHCSMPNVIPALNDARYAILDTMEDTIAHVIGAVVMTLVFKINPYHHKGANNVNTLIEQGIEFDRYQRKHKKVKANA